MRAMVTPRSSLLPAKHGAQKFARGLVLIDPPYEAQLDEFDFALAALREGLARWPQGMYALWYPIKQRRSLHTFYRKAAGLSAKSSLLLELLVRPMTPATHEWQRPAAAQCPVAV